MTGYWDQAPSARITTMAFRAAESPVWDAATNRLLFVDMHAPALHRYDAASGAVESWEMPSTIGSVALCADERAIVALRDGLYVFDFGSAALELLVLMEHGTHMRLNDGKVGPDGRFWVGSMVEDPALPPTAALYRVDPNGKCTCVVDGLAVSNGLAWSPDGGTMYHADSRLRFIDAYDYDLTTGGVSRRRTLARPSEATGRPDGAAVDSLGRYWSAGVSASCLNCFEPDGALAGSWALPVARPSMPCFGGADLRTLFVTTLSMDATSGATGTVLAIPVDVPGTPVARFGEPLAFAR